MRTHRTKSFTSATPAVVTSGSTTAPDAEGGPFEHEIAVIGCLLSPDNSAAFGAVQTAGLTRDDFRDTTLGRLFSALMELNHDGIPVDIVTLPDRLKAETIDAIGGRAGLNRVVDAAPPVAHASFHSRQIIEAAQTRRLCVLTESWVEASRNGTPLAELVARIRADVGGIDHQCTALPHIVSAGDFTAKPIPEPAQLVHGVLHAGSKAVYGGPSKAFKSWTLLDLSISVASGADWLGFRTTPGRVLYINFELQEFAVQRRLTAICQARGLPIPTTTLDLWNLRGHGCRLTRLLPYIRHLSGEGYSLIVPDPTYKMLDGRNENDAADMGEVCGELETVAVQTGAAVAFGAHFAKGSASGKDQIDRVAGSGVFARDPDAIITATPHEVESAFAVEMTLRNFAPPPPFVVQWEYPLMRRVEDLDPARLRLPKRRTGSAPDRPDVESLIPDAVALVGPKAVSVPVFKGKLYRMAGTQARVRELFQMLVGDGHLEELHARGRGRHEAWIGTSAQIANLRQRELPYEKNG